MTTEHDVAALREAAHAREADRAQFLLKKIFIQMEFVRALAVAAEQAYHYVDTFEGYHPGEIWPRRMILQIVNTATAPDKNIIEQAFQHFEAPGSANFIKAMYDLFQATQDTHQSEARIGFLVSAVVNALTAELVELYFGQRPEDWTAYRAQDANSQQIALAFWTDEAVAERDTALWLRVADAIETQRR